MLGWLPRLPCRAASEAAPVPVREDSDSSYVYAERDCEPLLIGGKCRPGKVELTSWQRDLAALSVGAIAGFAMFLFSCLIRLLEGAEVLMPRCPGLDDFSGGLNASALLEANQTFGHRYAFVQMAYDPPGTPLKHIWQVLPMARVLKRLSTFPLVVLTNTTHLPDGTALAKVLGRLNAEILPAYEVPVPAAARPYLTPSQRFSYWKIQIWRLTRFEKLIWLDTDAVLVRSIDWLFERAPTWAHQDSSSCGTSGEQEDSASSGLMLIEPKEETFHDLQRFAAQRMDHWWTHGEHQLVGAYFRDVVRRPLRLLDVGDASSGHCLGRTPSIPYESLGPWSVPAFVHKSSRESECFYFDLDKQKAVLNGKVVNICNYHPLGPFWRSLFCDAVKIIGARTNATEVFCDDYHWYLKR